MSRPLRRDICGALGLGDLFPEKVIRDRKMANERDWVDKAVGE